MINYVLKKLPFLVKEKILSVIIWDFDGTLYQSDDLANSLKENYRIFLEKKVRYKIDTNEFDFLSNKHGSWSKAVAAITGLSENYVITKVDNTAEKLKFIKRNDQIVQLISHLTSFRHVILTNATKKYVIHGLSNIGFKVSNKTSLPFESIFDRYTTQCLKPDPKSFEYVHKYTKLPKFRHLMIGDSYTQDILPAKKYGFFAAHVSEVPFLLKYS